MLGECFRLKGNRKFSSNGHKSFTLSPFESLHQVNTNVYFSYVNWMSSNSCQIGFLVDIYWSVWKGQRESNLINKFLNLSIYWQSFHFDWLKSKPIFRQICGKTKPWLNLNNFPLNFELFTCGHSYSRKINKFKGKLLENNLIVINIDVNCYFDSLKSHSWLKKYNKKPLE